MSSKKPSLVKLLSKTSSIITNHPLHFSTLSALLLLPISILTILSPFLFPFPSNYTQFLPFIPSPDSEKTETPPAPKPHLQILLLHTLLVLIFKACAVSSITRSTINAMHHNPLHLPTSLKSIPVSFLPILGTMLVAALIMSLILIALGIFMGLILFAFSLTFNTDYSSAYFIVLFFVIITALQAGAAIYIGMQWYLAYPVVVSESQCGFAPLKRSSDLVKGVRRVVLMAMMLFGIPSVVASMWYTKLAANCEGGWLIFEMVVYGGFATVVSLFSIVANTVLFVYCKELQDEYLPVSRINDEYVKVPNLDHEGLMLSSVYHIN